MSARSSGRDVTEAVKSIVSTNGLSDQEVDNLVASVNSALISQGDSERVSAEVVKAQTASADKSPSDTTGYCDQGPYPPQMTNVMNTLSQAASDICFYGCFAAVLYQTAASRYESVGQTLSDAGTAFTALIQQIAQAPDRWGDVGLEQLQSLENMVSDVVSNIGAIGNAFQGQSFSEIMWTYIKSYVARYGNHIMLGAAQKLVDELAEEVDLRSNRYALLDQKMVDLAEALQALVGYDWWDEFVAAVERAKTDLARADQELIRAQTGANTGNWDNEYLNKAQARLVLAKNGISSLDMIGGTIEELTQAFTSNDPFAFRWNAGRSVRQDFIEDLQTLGEVIDEVKEIVECILLQDKRIEILVALVTAIHSAISEVEGHISLNTSVDVQVDSDIISETRDGISAMHEEMSSCIDNKDRVGAPGYLVAWHAALSTFISGLEVVNIYPSTTYLDPLGVTGYTTDSIAEAKLATLVTKLADMKTPRAMTFVNGIIHTAGDMTRLMANRQSWLDRMGAVRTELRNASVADGQVVSECRKFSGYDNEYYNYVVDTLDDLGWRGAKEAIERGQVAQFLNMSLQLGAAFSLGLDCIGSILDGAPTDAGIALALGEEYSKMQAEAVVSIRAPAMLPAFQFEAITSLAGKLQEIQSQIERIAAIQGGVC
jgi:hypothetical protein